MSMPRGTSCTTIALRPAWRRAAGILAWSVLVSSRALAQPAHETQAGPKECTAEERLTFRGATARLENDLFTGTDQNYTNGVAFTLVSHDFPASPRLACLPLPVRAFGRLIHVVNPGFWAHSDTPADTQNVVVRLGQSMYTPGDPTRSELIVDDRPYAGVLYMGLAWNRRRHSPESDRETLDTREITLGVIGPWSLAEQSQNWIHDATGDDRFMGWGNQLKTEPAVQLALDRKFRGARSPGAIIPGFSADTVRSLGLRLGNIETSATVGLEGRLGWNLPNDFGSYPLRPGAENRPPSAVSIHGTSRDAIPATRRPRAGIHVFGILELKAVAYDFSLDGNLFRSSHSVSRRPWVAQAALGVSTQGIVAGHGLRLAAMRVYRTREFDEQGTNQSFGSIALSIDF